jgi:PhnB protein
MSHSYKPEGYSTVSPYLIVNGAASTIGFLEGVFGAQEIRRFTNPDGTINHAEVRLDETVLMIADAVEEWPAVPAHIHVYVSDADQVYRRALDAGAESIQEPVQKGDPDKRGGVTFPTGLTWWIATHMGEV